ncbi:NAD-dependent epimerase/dehydratase family protein [Microvirga sp. TS319]|uniref:NAD-dependent epimerase/dehydratase family protein n=1 Tax=Microvirga sp. TS319 TaxID=3241165 RepID=UPI00351A1963
MTRALVIGGSGFVGRAIVRRLQEQGCQVTVLNRGSRPIAGTRQLIADRNDPVAVGETVKNQAFEVVIDTNCYRPDQALILAEALRGRAPRLVMISSAAVYANKARRPPSETEPVGGASVWGDYGRDKSHAEDVYADADHFDRVVFVRPPYIFGPGNNLDRETWFWSRQCAGTPILLPGEGTTQAQFIHEDDLAEAVEGLAFGPGHGIEAFNVADPQVLTLSELATMLAEAAGVPDRQIRAGSAASGLPARSWFPFRDYPCLADPGRLMSTGWRPAASLAIRFAETHKSLSRSDLIPPPVISETEQQIVCKLRARIPADFASSIPET